MLAEYERYFQKLATLLQKNDLGEEYIRASDNGGQYFSKGIKLYRYNCLQSKFDLKRIILIVPSLFNSPNILFINKTKNFVECLQDIATVYLIDWQEIKSPDHKLDDYVFEIIELLKYLIKNFAYKIDLIGHCIGGTLSLVAANLHPELLNSVTLLNTPWNFSYLEPQRIICKQLQFDEAIKHLDQVPKIYQQMLFFLLNPEHYQKKIVKFFETLNRDRQGLEIFLKTEYWLFSGKNLPRTTYLQLTEQIVDQNILEQNKWFIGDKLVSDLKIKLPVCIVAAERDNIAPLTSTISLLKIIKSSTLIKVDGGHISYLISSKINNFFAEYKYWFSSCNREK